MSSSSSDPRYCCVCYDIMTNLTANHEDTRLILNRGLAVGEDRSGGLYLRGKGDSSLSETIDSKQMTRNLCASQKYHRWCHFLTFTCNTKTHFGTAPIKNWINGNEWKSYYPGYDELESDEKKEIETALVDASASLLLRVWEEVSSLFIDYLRKSPSSPFKKLKSIFSRKEDQKDRGNLSHFHMMIALDWDSMTDDEKHFVDDLIRASICDIVKDYEIPRFVNEGVFDCDDDIYDVYENGVRFLPHKCNDACLVKKADGTFRCRKVDNLRSSPDNTKHQFVPLPNDYTVPCLKILQRLGLSETLESDSDGNVLKFKSSLPFFHPARHVPPTNPTFDLNISPVEGYIFSVCKSMQNVQRLVRQAGGCAKYVCKYISKEDEQNFVVIQVDGEGKLVSSSTFLHNTKVVSSKIAEDKDREQYKHKAQGRCISHMEMMHLMLGYVEVVTNLDFCNISTMPLELRAGIKIDSDCLENEDGNYITTEVDNFRRNALHLDAWRWHTDSQLLILDDLKLSKISIDKVTQFSLRPPELMSLFDTLGNYFRWFQISKNKIKVNDLPGKLSASLSETCWIDGLQRQIRLRRKAIGEVKKWCMTRTIEDDIDLDNTEDSKCMMVLLMLRICNSIEPDYQ